MYSATLQAYSPGWFGKTDLEVTGKVLLPSSALNDIYGRSDNLPQVVLFCILNPKTRMKIYAGVDSFTAPAGQICIPYWMMEAIQVNEGEQVRVNTTPLPVGTSATFQPKDSSFMGLKDQKVVLEHTLRQHPCLTQGSVIPIDFAKRRYYLKILKTEPKEGIFTLKADLAVEFAPPETDFTHRWLEPDTDSSDDLGEVKEYTGRTLRGKEVSYKDERKIMHSTFESREKARLAPGATDGVRKFTGGQEILPPKPDESTMVAKEKKTEAEKKLYQGSAHTIKRSKSKGSTDSLVDAAKAQPASSVQAPQLAPIATGVEEPPKPTFTGKGRTIRGKVREEPVPIAAAPPPAKDGADAHKEPEFKGNGRTLSGKTVLAKITSEQPPDPNLLYGKKPETKIDDPFKGKAHTLK